jgi:hypothetical protein
VTREFSPQIQQIAAALILEAGNGLYSVIREPGVTCPVCATPPNPGYPLCRSCQDHVNSGLPLADRVGSLVYAIKPDTQLYKIVHDYKSPMYANTRLPTIMSALLALGMRSHFECAARLSGQTTHGWTVVPSTRGRTTLRDLVIGIGGSLRTEVPVQFIGTPGERALRPESWAVRPSVVFPQHVVVADDSWVSGRHAQSVAAALKAHGVHQVSIFTAARVLERSYGPNQEFIDTRLRSEGFDWRRCPWTGAGCPE